MDIAYSQIAVGGDYWDVTEGRGAEQAPLGSRYFDAGWKALKDTSPEIGNATVDNSTQALCVINPPDPSNVDWAQPALGGSA